VGIWCVYLQSSADPGTGRRMSQLPVQGRIPHQASPFGSNERHLEMQQLNPLIKLALLTSDRLQPFHADASRAKRDGKRQSPPRLLALQEELPKRWGLRAPGEPCPPPRGAQRSRCSPRRVNPGLWSSFGCPERFLAPRGKAFAHPRLALPWGCRGARGAPAPGAAGRSEGLWERCCPPRAGSRPLSPGHPSPKLPSIPRCPRGEETEQRQGESDGALMKRS